MTTTHHDGKNTMHLKIKTATVAITLALGVVMSASAQTPSTFQDSCSNIRYGEEGGNAMIYADCRRSDGSVNAASVVIKGIDNKEGRLSHTAGNNPSTFQRTCQNMSLALAGPSGVELRGSCQTSQGNYVDTTTAIWDVNNIEGNLQYPY
jgi:hypothetical protein